MNQLVLEHGRIALRRLRADIDHRFDHARFRLRVRRELFDQLIKATTMRDPRPRVDAARFDQADDLREIVWQRVAGTQQRSLAFVKHRVAKADFITGKSDEYEPSTLGNID